MSDIGVGDWVEALATYSCPLAGLTHVGITQGQRYRVASTSRSPTDAECGYWECEACGAVTHLEVIDLEELPIVPGFAYCPCQFKPVDGPRTSIVQAVCQPIDPQRPGFEEPKRVITPASAIRQMILSEETHVGGETTRRWSELGAQPSVRARRLSRGAVPSG